MNTVEVFPDDQLVVVKYRGDVRMADVVKLTQEMVSLPGYSPSFNGVTDHRGVNLLVTQEEIRAFSRDAISNEVSLGTWCLICDAPLTTAFMLIFKSQLESRHPVEIVSTVDAASYRLGVDLEKYLDPDQTG